MLLYFDFHQNHLQRVWNLEVQHVQICIEIDYTTISTLHKLIDKWLTQSVQNGCNSLDAFKPVFKIGFLSLILIASLHRRMFQFLWWSIILVFICTKFTRDVLWSCTSSTMLSENSDGVNLAMSISVQICTCCTSKFHTLWRWLWWKSKCKSIYHLDLFCFV